MTWGAVHALDEGHGIAVEIFHVIATLCHLASAVAAMIIGQATITVPQGMHLGIKMAAVHQIAMGKDDRLRARSHFVIMELCTIDSNRRHCAHLPRWIGMANFSGPHDLQIAYAMTLSLIGVFHHLPSSPAPLPL